MDALNSDKLKQAVLKILRDYEEFLGKDPDGQIQLVIDERQNHYLLIEIGWQKKSSYLR